MKQPFFEYVAECCRLLGWPKAQGVDMMPKVDPCWFYAWEDGTPAEVAVREYKEQTEKDLNRMSLLRRQAR